MWLSKFIREIFNPLDGYISSVKVGRSMILIKNWKVDWEWKNVVFQSDWRRTLLKNNKSIFLSLRSAYSTFVFPQQASIHNRTSLYQFIVFCLRAPLSKYNVILQCDTFYMKLCRLGLKNLIFFIWCLLVTNQIIF